MSNPDRRSPAQRDGVTVRSGSLAVAMRGMTEAGRAVAVLLATTFVTAFVTVFATVFVTADAAAADDRSPSSVAPRTDQTPQASRAASNPAVPAPTSRPWVTQMRDLGREATPAEVAAWDIDVRPDFKGLPKGQGSVADGEQVWDAKCASCHGIFGESNEVFTPLVGGTTKEDISHGLVAGLHQGGPRTTLMKVSTISTLWDYINRAMPWNAPRTLKTDEVYAALAYMLNLGGIVDDDFVLSDQNIAEVQERMPNRDGMTKRHGLWAVDGKPDVKAVACMKDCSPLPSGVAAGGGRLPEHARDAHGNLADQQRLVGPLRGAVTVGDGAPPASFDAMRQQAAGLTPAALAKAASSGAGAGGTAGGAGPGGGAPGAAATEGAAGAAGAEAHPDATALLKSAGCTACHGVDARGIGPSMREIADKYAGRADRVEYLAGKIASGGQGVWGAIPMPPQAAVSGPDREVIARWLAEGLN